MSEEQLPKGWARQAFEFSMRLDHAQCVLDERGHYVSARTHEMWMAFKFGLACSPRRSTFVISEMRNGAWHFETTPAIYEFKDLARVDQRKQAVSNNAITAIFQQVSAYDPQRLHIKNK